MNGIQEVSGSIPLISTKEKSSKIFSLGTFFAHLTAFLYDHTYYFVENKNEWGIWKKGTENCEELRKMGEN